MVESETNFYGRFELYAPCVAAAVGILNLSDKLFHCLYIGTRLCRWFILGASNKHSDNGH